MNYSLSEAANKIGATSAWINRVQRETGIGGGTGKKGHKVSFDDSLVDILGRVKIFRLLGFSFRNIKDLYELESSLLILEKSIKDEYEISQLSEHTIPLLLHFNEILAFGPLFPENLNEVSKEILYREKNIEEYIKDVENLHYIAKEMMRKRQLFMKSVEYASGMADAIKERYPGMS